MIRSLTSDRGSIMPLTVFFAFLSLALILVVVAATSLYIERKRLFTLADGAALVGAEAFTIDSVTVTSSGPRPTLQPADVSAAVTAYLAKGGPTTGAAPSAPITCRNARPRKSPIPSWAT